MQFRSNNFYEYKVVLQPDKDLPDWWAGAPSVTLSKDGTFYLAARMRHSESPRGRRGYEIRILSSGDGITFDKIKSIHRDEVSIHGFERPSILQDPRTRKFKLYGCGELKDGNEWGIWKLEDVDNPGDFDPGTFEVVLRPKVPEKEFGGAAKHHATSRTQYKDPFIIWLKDEWHMFVIGFDRVERPYHFKSKDGLDWLPVSENPILDSTGWHNFFTRPACLLPLKVGYLLVYEGSNITWRDPGYNIATGLSYSLDLKNFIDLTPNEPFLRSTTPGDYHTWRYSHWLPVKDEIFVYFEASRPNNSNETRLSILGKKEQI
ncbi:MAG: hypothetical protein ACFFCS_29770 [Candidatus Hodarchaeota archaeon]